MFKKNHSPYFFMHTRYRIAGIFSGEKLSRIKGEASFRDSYFHDHSNFVEDIARTILLFEPYS